MDTVNISRYSIFFPENKANHNSRLDTYLYNNIHVHFLDLMATLNFTIFRGLGEKWIFLEVLAICRYFFVGWWRGSLSKLFFGSIKILSMFWGIVRIVLEPLRIVLYVERCGAVVKRRTRDPEVPGSIPTDCKCCFLEQETLSTLLSTGFYPGKKRATWKISTRLLNVLPSINKVDYYYYYYL